MNEKFAKLIISEPRVVINKNYIKLVAIYLAKWQVCYMQFFY